MNEATRRLNPQLLDPREGGGGPGSVVREQPELRTNWKNDGRGFQKEIEITNGGYQSARRATIRKVDPPTRLVGSGANPRVLFLTNPFLDFVGSWTSMDGRAIFFEAKSTATHRLRLGDGGLTDAQVNALRVWRDANASAFVLWQFNGEVRLVRLDVIDQALARGEKSLVFGSCQPVRRGVGSILWDYLAALLEHPGQEKSLAR